MKAMSHKDNPETKTDNKWDPTKLVSAAPATTPVVLILSIIAAATVTTGYLSMQFYQFYSPCDVQWRVLAAAGSGSNSTSAKPPASTAKDIDVHYKGMKEHPACAFFRSSNQSSHEEHRWGRYNLCMEQTNEWYERSKVNCYSCLNPELNVCQNPPMIYYHQYLEKLHPQHWEGNLLAMKAFLITQDLTRSHMIIWLPTPELVYNNKTSAFFDAFTEHITLQPFDYSAEVKGTPWERDQFFGNGMLVKQMMPAPGAYSDVVRIIALHKYGGLWMDNDVVLYNDVTHLLATSYQFVMRKMNLHIMYIKANSTLTWRTMELAKTMPLNHPNFYKEIVEKRCKPIGYYPLVKHRYGNTDIYNGCLHRMLLRFNNTGLSPEATLYDLPLGWWDHDWIGCFGSREGLDDARWHKVASTYLAMHNRYPMQNDTGPETSPLRRVMKITNEFFARCDNVKCLSNRWDANHSV